MPAPPPPTPSPFAAAPSLLRFGVMIEKKIGPSRTLESPDTTSDSVEMHPVKSKSDAHSDAGATRKMVQTRNDSARALDRSRGDEAEAPTLILYRQYVAPFTPFISILCAAVAGTALGLVRAAPQEYCRASTSVTVALNALAFAIAALVRPSVFMYENLMDILSDGFTLVASVCTMLIAHDQGEGDVGTEEEATGMALRDIVQLMGLLATIVSTSGKALGLARTGLLALSKVRVVPLVQFLRDVDARIEWFLLADVDGEVWI
jgi:hypothetical protein